MNTDLWPYFLLLAIVWTYLVVRTVRHFRAVPAGSVGLPAALLMTMSFLYGGAFVYAVPGYTHLRPGGHWYLVGFGFTESMVLYATFVSLIGVLGFTVGCGALPLRWRRKESLIEMSPTELPPASYQRTALWVLGATGLIGFIAHYGQVSFEMSQALIEAMRNVAIAFLCVGAFVAFRQGRSYVRWLVLALLIPVYYLAVWGFVSYGFLVGMALLGFWMNQLQPSDRVRRPAWVNAAISVGVIYILLTVFVAWFSFRDEIRDVIWQGEEGSVLEILWRASKETQLFSPFNFEALDLINIRLNLNLFIGRMIEQHELFPELRQNGATLIILPLVLLPRFLWPDKPTRGGSDFMEAHTGLTLSDSASFGTGSVFEFYINFGVVGVFLGFLVLGWVLARLDRAAARHLRSGDFMSFARLYVVGIVAIDPLLRPFFIVNGAVFAWIVMTALKFPFARRRRAAAQDGPRP